VREFLNDLSTRVWAERSLFAALGLHLLGLHGLAAARSWLLKAPAGFCLLASIVFLIQGLRITPPMLGVNATTICLLGVLAILAGAWLLVGGRTSTEWLIGFGISGLGAAAVLFAAGQRLAAVTWLTCILPFLGIVWWFGDRSVTNQEETVGWIERNTSWLALVVASFAVAAPLLAWKPAPLGQVEARPRLRDFVTQPSSILLLSVGAALSLGVAVRIRPPAARGPM
jgi:hypothetical protein